MAREERLLKTNNLGAFYKFINNKLSSRSSIAPLVDPDGKILTSDLDKATLMNRYFESVFTTDNGNLPSFASRFDSPSHPTLDSCQFSPESVSRQLGKLKSNSAAGVDALPAIFFKKTAPVLSFPLCILFQSFIDLHDVPNEWKRSIICPIFKKGSSADPSNYRPISLTCSCCKIMESLIVVDLNNFLFENNLISKHQHGFLKRHSTSTNLLE